MLGPTEEMTTQREVASACAGNSLAAFVTNALPQSKQAVGGNSNQPQQLLHMQLNGDKSHGGVDFGMKDDFGQGNGLSSASSNGEVFKNYSENKSFGNENVFRLNGEKKKHVSAPLL